MDFVKGFNVSGEFFQEGRDITVVLSDGEAVSNVKLTTASAKKIGVTVDGENFERVFELKDVATIK